MVQGRTDLCTTQFTIVGGRKAEIRVYREWLTLYLRGDADKDRSSGLKINAISPKDYPASEQVENTIFIIDAQDVSRGGSQEICDAASLCAIWIHEGKHCPNVPAPLHIEKPLTRAKFYAALDAIDGQREAIQSTTEFDHSSRLNFANNVGQTVCPAPSHFTMGSSKAIRTYLDLMRRAARSNAPVFIHGEPGTGKSAAAQALHDHSTRADQPCIAISCGLLSPETEEVEIFGEERSIVAGGERRTGAVELADRGTLVLHDICELSQRMQSRLLHMAKSGTLRRAGSTRSRRVDVRLVCTSATEPFEALGSGSLREDFFYAIHVLSLTLPVLRDRTEDMESLIATLAEQAARRHQREARHLSPETRSLLLTYPWPGNVRELDNLLNQITLLSETVSIDPATLVSLAPHLVESQEFAAASPLHYDDGDSLIEPFWRQEQRIIEHAITVHEGHIAKAAEALEISPSTIYRKMQVWQDRDEELVPTDASRPAASGARLN